MQPRKRLILWNSSTTELESRGAWPRETIVDFLEGKVGVYTRFFDFANYRIPLSQFLFDILGYYQIHLSQLLVIGATKVSNFEINCRVHNIISTQNLFRVFYIPSFNLGWISFSKRPGKNTSQCYTKPLDSLKNWNNRFFWIDERIFPTDVDWRTSAPRDEMPSVGSYFAADVTLLDTNHAPFQRLPENLLCLVGLSQNYYLGDDMYPTFLYDDDREMDLFSLNRNPNPFKVKTETRPCATHEVPLLTAIASRVIDMEDPTMAFGSLRTPSTVERSLLDFENEDPAPSLAEGARAEEHVQEGLAQRSFRRRCTKKRWLLWSRLSIKGNTPTTVSDPEPLSYAKPQSHPMQDIAQFSKGAAAEIPTKDVATTEVNVELSMGSPNSGKSTSPSVGASPGGIYQLGWGVTNNCRLDSSEACKDMVDHIVPPWEEEIKKLDEEIRSLRIVETEVHCLRNRTQNLEMLLEAEIDIKKVAEAKSVDLAGELESLRAQLSDIQVNNHQLSQQVSTLQAQVTEMDARLDALSIDFDEELYPHMLTEIAGHRWVIRHGYERGLKYGVEHGEAKLDLAAIEAYDPKVEAKYVVALTALRDLKYPLIDQLKIPLYPEVCNPRDPWSVQEEMLLEDAIAANKSRTEKKKKCRVVCRTNGVGSAHHARSDGIPVSTPTIAPHGLAILLADAVVHTEASEDEACSRLLRSKSLPPMYNLD
ncbi:hypothetical protein Tco_0962286 [Tanacetum coccineum]